MHYSTMNCQSAPHYTSLPLSLSCTINCQSAPHYTPPPLSLSCAMNSQSTPHYTPTTIAWLVLIYRRIFTDWLVADRIGMLVVIGVDVRLQYFMLYTISVHRNCCHLCSALHCFDTINPNGCFI